MTAIPVRFALFAALCAGWMAAMTIGDHPLVHAAGVAWFVNWSVQITVTLVSWVHPFALPNRYYQPWGRAHGRPAPRLVGAWIFEAVVRRINPFPFAFDRRSFATIEGVMRAAETTHALTFTIGIVLTAGFAATGSSLVALCLAFWNVIFNAYAIALQRRNRARIQRLARKRAARTTSAPQPADRRRRAHPSAAASSSL